MTLKFCGVIAGSMALLLAGCADPDVSAAQPQVTVTATVTETVTEAPTSARPSRSSEEMSSSPLGEPSPQPTLGDQGGQPQDLQLGDAHQPEDGWEEGFFDVADRGNVRGIGTTVTSCGDVYDDAAELEFRLANHFDSVSLAIGQSNDSQDSDQSLNVQVLGNGEQLDLRQVPFNRVENLADVPVAGVNALRIRIYLDESACSLGGGQRVTAVLHDMTAQ